MAEATAAGGDGGEGGGGKTWGGGGDDGGGGGGTWPRLLRNSIPFICRRLSYSRANSVAAAAAAGPLCDGADADAAPPFSHASPRT